jgi:GDP-4-dehydro-6-deoxy-D-mannose reductase
MTKILVTGSNGFIGSNLIPKLHSAGYQVIPIDIHDGDIAKEETWKNLPGTNVVVHLAAKSFVPESWLNSHEYFRCNLLGTAAALNYCKTHHSRMIFLSSYMYGNAELMPINENAKLNPTNPYALSKKLAEELCAFYARNLGVETTILRPFNIYGPGQSENFMIQSVISQIIKGGAIHVKDLEPKRDYVYIDDVVNAILKAITIKSSWNTVNIGSGISYSVSEVIQILQDILGTNLPVVSGNERRQGEIMNTVADIEKAKEVLGWQPLINFHNGLRKIIESTK